MSITYKYFDGESHYIRSRDAWRAIHGPHATLEGLRVNSQPQREMVLVIPKAHILLIRNFDSGHRCVYFTSASGDEDALYDMRVQVRGFGVEPVIIPERKALAEQRKNALNNLQVIEKAKGVDAALAVRVLEDAYNDNFDTCEIHTSDVDILPVIEAVRRKGKRVMVKGYKAGLADRSPLLYAPDWFHDLEQQMREHCHLLSAPAPAPST